MLTRVGFPERRWSMDPVINVEFYIPKECNPVGILRIQIDCYNSKVINWVKSAVMISRPMHFALNLDQ